MGIEPDTMQYVGNSIAWSIVGSILTVVVQQVKGGRSMAAATENGSKRKSTLHRSYWLSLLGFIIMGMSLAGVIGSYIAAHRQAEYTECQTEVNGQFRQALTARAQATTTDRDALDKMVTDVLGARTREDSVRALEQYRMTRAETDAERRRNPLPEPTGQCKR